MSNAHSLLDINPDCSVKAVEILDGHRCVVVDNFLADPVGARVHALSRSAEFAELGRYYPGPELAVTPEMLAAFNRWWRRNLCDPLGVMRGGAASLARYSVITKQAHEVQLKKRFCHQDPVDSAGRPDVVGLAGVLYLFDDPRLGGTSFFRKRENASFEEVEAWHREGRLVELAAKYLFYFQPPRYMIESNPLFERVQVVEAAFNRAVFFNRSVYHTPHLTHPELLVADSERGRLTMNFFIDATRIPEAG